MGLIYLAGSIDLVNENERHDWREEMTVVLNEIGHSVFNPATAFSVRLEDHEVSRKLIRINEEAMFASDFVIMVLSPNKASIGTPIELFMLSRFDGHKCPELVVIWNPEDTPEKIYGINFERFKLSKIEKALPAYLAGMTSNIVTSFEDAIAFTHWIGEGRDRFDFFRLPQYAFKKPNKSKLIPVQPPAPAVNKSAVVGHEEDGYPD